MAGGIVQGNPELDFFEQNPELRYISLCQEVLSREKGNASKVMWAVYLTEDPNSRLYNVPYTERRREVAINFFKDENYDWEDIKYVITGYPRTVLTKEEIMFKIWGDKLDMLTAHVKDLNLETDSGFNKTFKVMEKMDKIWSTYDTVKNKMVEQKTKSRLQGGGSESRREARGKR